MKRKHDESKLQIAVVRWFRLQFPNDILFAIGNGGKRSVITASIMKAEGVLAGICDLCLILKNGNCVFIEMKTEKGVLSSTQKELHTRLRSLGHTVEICRTFEQFEDMVWHHLTGNVRKIASLTK